MSTAELNPGTFDAAIEIAARRRDTQRRVKELLIANKDQEALKLMRQYFGIEAKPRLALVKDK